LYLRAVAFPEAAVLFWGLSSSEFTLSTDALFDALVDAIFDGGLGLDLHRLEPIEEVAITDPVPRTHPRCSQAPSANLGAKALNPDRCRTVGESAKTFG
jgi:hypothetical protein